MVYDHNMQSTHCREAPSLRGDGTLVPETERGGVCGPARTTLTG